MTPEEETPAPTQEVVEHELAAEAGEAEETIPTSDELEEAPRISEYPEETTPLLPITHKAVDDNDDDAILPGYAVAAWIVDETMRGARISNVLELPRTRANRRAYLFFEHGAPFRQLATVLLVLLSFFELPSWCSSTRVCVSPDGSDLFLSGVPYLPPLWSGLVNAVLISVLIFFAAYDMFKLPMSDLHFRTRWLRALLALLVLDLGWVSWHSGFPPFRFAPYLRALLPLFYWHSLRECTMGVVAIVGPFGDVVSIVTLFGLVFGWFVTLMFHDVPAADRYFGNLTVGLYSTFTSLTTADWPMQIMAVLDVSRASAILFLFFILIGVFLFFNVLLAVVYNAYTSHIEELVIDKLHARRESLGLAYDELIGDNDYCQLSDLQLMFGELRKNKKLRDVDDERANLIFTALDDNSDSLISRNEFLDIIEVLQLKFVIELESVSPVEKFFPELYNTSFWQSVASYVRSDALKYHMGIIMVLNVAVVLFESTMDLEGADTNTSVELFALVECGFSFIYIAEMVLKVASQGFNRFWKDIGNRFDFAVTWLLLFGAVYVLYPFSRNDPEIVRYLVALRCLRLFAVLADVPRFRRIVQVFSILIPASVPLFSFFFLSLYVFAAAGVEFFGGLIYASNPALNPVNNRLVDAYVGNDYWALNFNDMASGWYTLFSAVIVGYLTEVAEAIASTAKYGDWTKLFFIASFVVNSLVVSNCVVAFVVDLFIEEDEQEDDLVREDLEARYGSKRVKVLKAKTTADEVYANMFRERVREIFETTS